MIGEDNIKLNVQTTSTFDLIDTAGKSLPHSFTSDPLVNDDTLNKTLSSGDNGIDDVDIDKNSAVTLREEIFEAEIFAELIFEILILNWKIKFYETKYWTTAKICSTKFDESSVQKTTSLNQQ